MSISDVDPVRGPNFTPPTAGLRSARVDEAQQQAQQFATLLRAQMGSLITSAALGGFNQNGAGGMSGGLFGSGSGGLFGSGSGGLFGGGLGSLLGGSSDNLLLMQTLQPLTEALNRLVDRLDQLDGLGSGGFAGGEVRRIATPDSLPFRDLIERLGKTYQVPAAFLGAVMMAESGGDPDAVGDDGAAVGLFQLHERGMGMGLGELRRDAELNAAIGARGLAEGWHEGLRRDLQGEELVRFAYDYRFNPGGGFAAQGDSVYSYFRFYDALARREGAAA